MTRGVFNLYPGRASVQTQHVGDELLERDDQPLALGQEPAALDDPRADAPLNRLDELRVLDADLVVEGDELLDPRVLDPGREEVVEEALGPLGADRYERADREVRRPRLDVDLQVREQEVELPPSDLAGRVVRRAPVSSQRPVLREERAVELEPVRIGGDVE